ncbi:MocR-like pyridoxine biosynthesis transcription factor PdxR [Alicyclobacillus sp. ALC3]|uniref:MocR-like pyridoxine biosynthesis transcription factor PdxR n=1 Tax=Alicyclobacillus sp. ALC3 TaxID=2796143 RepID=UPI0023781FAA|nr:PLP-dependent aminotransferase family protein [Alicyclobacillus sp. ALC3]WDL98084.1 PLP-dependent aminotransferase family protein [Alicyclobacillus sp. ALC3]
MFDLAFHVNNETKLPYYRQLYWFIRTEIEAGRIAVGTKLPSVRELATSLQISKTTVESAYQQLVAEGYITSTSRTGFFSLPPEETFVRPSRTQTLTAHSGADETATCEIDFHPAHTDTSQFPKTTWRKLFNEVLNNMDDETLQFGNPLGEWGLRQQIAQYLQQSRGVRCTSDQIVIGNGLHSSIQLLWQLLNNDRTMLAMEDPGYTKVRSWFHRLSVPVIPIEVEDDGLSVKGLQESQANLAYVTPSHQFPNGMVMSYTKRKQLLQWASVRNRFILEDDYDGEFRYTEKPIPSLQGLDMNDTVVYIGTFSKSLSSALRMNYMVLPIQLLNRLMDLRLPLEPAVSRILQAVMERFMESGHWETHLRRMRRVYRKKHEVLIESLRAEFGSSIVLKGYGAGLHVSVTLVDHPRKEVELIESAESVGVGVYNFPQSREHTDSYSPTLYLGFGGLTPEQIRDGVHRLRRVWL